MLMRSISSTSTATTLHACARAVMRSYSFSRTAADSTLESSSPLMRRAGSTMNAATTTGPAKGAQPASSTPATSPMSGQRRSLCRGRVAKMPAPSITEVMQASEDVGAIGIAQLDIAAVEIVAVTAVAQQRVGDEERIARQVGGIQQQRRKVTDIEHRIVFAPDRQVETFQHVIRDVLWIGHARAHGLGERIDRAIERRLVVAEVQQQHRAAIAAQEAFQLGHRRVGHRQALQVI